MSHLNFRITTDPNDEKSAYLDYTLRDILAMEARIETGGLGGFSLGKIETVLIHRESDTEYVLRIDCTDV